MGDKYHPVRMFETNQGGRIFQISLNAFPGFWVYAYLVLVGDYKVLIDTGSNFEASNEGLEAGLQTVGEMIGESLGLADLTHILITHGHIDHFGGLAYIRPRSSAKIGVHELDRRNLTNYEERLVIVAQRLRRYLFECGVSAERVEDLYNMYMFPKALFNSVDVDFTYGAIGMQMGPFEMLHVPGHCAGMVMIRLHDIMFSADHVLSSISPHQAPEHLTLNTGLGHYLASLQTAKQWAQGVRLTLGGHQNPIEDLPGRIEVIAGEHAARLQKVIACMPDCSTVAEISKELFGQVGGYNILLALEETGAHIEYLYQRGYLGIANLSEISKNNQPVPIRYCRLVDQFDTTSIF